MKIKIVILIFSIAIVSCEYNKSVNIDLVTDITTKGDGLSCGHVYLTVDDEIISRNTFTYGEEFYLNFNNILGFKKENESVFPGIRIFVTDKTGDTIMQTNDLYDIYDAKGLNISPLELTASLTTAKPMQSDNEYTLFVNIWDKKDKGTFTAKMDFNVITNKLIEIEENNVSYNEIYIFSKNRNIAVTDNKISSNENIYIMFEGLSGFSEKDEMVFPGLALKITDVDGKVILDYPDLFENYAESGVSTADLNARISADFTLGETEFNNPISCEVTVWDRISDANIKTTTKMNVE